MKKVFLADLPVNLFRGYLESNGANILRPTNEWEVLRYTTQEVTQRKNCTVTNTATHVVYKKATGQITFTGDSRIHYGDFKSDRPIKTVDLDEPTKEELDKFKDYAADRWQEQVDKWEKFLDASKNAPEDQRQMSLKTIRRFLAEARKNVENIKQGKKASSLAAHKTRAAQSAADTARNKIQGRVAKFGKTGRQKRAEEKIKKYGVSTLYDDYFDGGTDLTVNQFEAKQILMRDGDDCFACLRPLGTDMSREHILPKSVGGGEHLHNKVLMHVGCNAALEDMPVGHKLEAIMEMRKEAELEEEKNYLSV